MDELFPDSEDRNFKNANVAREYFEWKKEKKSEKRLVLSNKILEYEDKEFL